MQLLECVIETMNKLQLYSSLFQNLIFMTTHDAVAFIKSMNRIWYRNTSSVNFEIKIKSIRIWFIFFLFMPSWVKKKFSILYFFEHKSCEIKYALENIFRSWFLAMVGGLSKKRLWRNEKPCTDFFMWVMALNHSVGLSLTIKKWNSFKTFETNWVHMIMQIH